MTDEGTRSEARVFTVVLAGEPVLGKNVALLATMLDDHPLAQRLERGLAQRNSNRDAYLRGPRDADRAAERSALGLGWAPKHAPPTTADAATAPAELLNRL